MPSPPSTTHNGGVSDEDASRRDTPTPRRPALRSTWDALVGDTDPADRSALAHDTAAAVVHLGRSPECDDDLTARLVGLADEVGLESLAELWRQSAPDSLPGTLWALYLLRTWVRGAHGEASRVYAAGRPLAEVSDAVAGVADPPGPEEIASLGDAVLTSVFDGDLAVALERAAAFSRVVAAGRLSLADDADDLGDDLEAARQTRLASGNVRLADQLTTSARLWRQGALR
jgi:hypothetical protein